MGAIATAFNQVYRDFVTDGVLSSGDHEALKVDIRGLGMLIEAAIGTMALGSVDVTKDTRAHLDADLAWAADSTALVYADATDANNDLYVKVGASGTGSWTLTTILHDLTPEFPNPVTEPLAIEPGTAAEAEDAFTVERAWNDGLEPIDGGREPAFRLVSLKVSYDATNQIYDTGAHTVLRSTVSCGDLTDFPWLNLNPPTKGVFAGGEMPGTVTLRDPQVTAGTSFAGISYASGLFNLFQGFHPDTGRPNPIVSIYFDDFDGEHGTTTSVIRGWGTNRLSLESAGAMVIQTDTGHIELEGDGGKIDIIGFRKGTDTGYTVKFTNQGQNSGGVCPAGAFTANHAIDAFQIGFRDGGGDTVLAGFDGYGRVYAPVCDLAEQATPGNPAADTARIYAKDIAGATGLAFRDSAGAETVVAGIASPAFSGVPTAPTAAGGTNTTQLATTAFVAAAAAAMLVSPAFSGVPTAPTAAGGTNTTQIATTAFVSSTITALIGGAPGALDTLDELAAAINDDASYAASIVTALGLKAPLASPALTGTPTAPTASGGTNTTQIATTAFVGAAITAAKASPTFSGTTTTSDLVASTLALNGTDIRDVAISTQTGTSYTLATGDRGTLVRFTNGAAIAVTLPNSLPVGTTIVIRQAGAGQVTFAAASGATLTNADSLTKTRAQGSKVVLTVEANVGGSAAAWYADGDMA